MKYLQDSINSATFKKESNTLVFFHIINFLFLVLNFIFNFTGNPALKFLYLIHVIFIIITSFIYRLDQVLPEIITLFFIEGQGRILWEYQSWARIIFDFSILISVSRVFLLRRKFFDLKIVPLPIMILIVCHVLWYSIQLFNIYAASVFGVISALKIYIFPILMFLGFSMSNINVNSKHFTRLLIFFTLILTAELFLNYYQFLEKQNLLYQISSYYFTAMKNGVFTGLLFRPFATTQLPGALSAFLFLTVGFLFFRPLSFKMSLLRTVIIAFSIFNLIICQVRSALIKYLLIIGLIYLGGIIFHRLKFKKVFPLLLLLIIGLGVLQDLDSKLNSFFSSTNDETLSYSVDRVTALAQTGKMKSSRIDSETFITKVFDQISEYPLGVGPGMTGPAASINQESLLTDPLLNTKTLWTHDNLFISLFIDLGIGAIFYILLIFSIPIYFVKALIKFYKRKDEHHFQIVLICTCSQVVILLGNWGALGLTYNPESFIYWFFAALGFYSISSSRAIHERFIPS